MLTHKCKTILLCIACKFCYESDKKAFHLDNILKQNEWGPKWYRFPCLTMMNDTKLKNN